MHCYAVVSASVYPCTSGTDMCGNNSCNISVIVHVITVVRVSITVISVSVTCQYLCNDDTSVCNTGVLPIFILNQEIPNYRIS